MRLYSCKHSSLPSKLAATAQRAATTHWPTRAPPCTVTLLPSSAILTVSMRLKSIVSAPVVTDSPGGTAWGDWDGWMLAGQQAHYYVCLPFPKAKASRFHRTGAQRHSAPPPPAAAPRPPGHGRRSAGAPPL